MTLMASVTYLRVLSMATEGTGIDLAAVLRDVGLSREVLADDDARVPLEPARRAWVLAAERSADPDFGLRSAQRVRATAFELIEYLGRTASTVREALENVARYGRIVTDDAQFAVEERGREVCFRDRSPGSPRHFAELFLAIIVLRLRDLGLPEGGLIGVTFLHPRPASTSTHEEFFRAPIAFGGAETALLFTANAAAHRLPTADDTLRGVLERHARELLESLPAPADDLVARVQRALEEHLAARRDIDIDAIAKQLAIGRRTMQRRLSEQGTSFHAVLDGARRETAIRLVRRGVAPSSVAFVVGFADVSAFHRAFKRWTGATPAKFAR